MRAPKRSLIKEEDSKLKIRATTEMPELEREGKMNLKTIDDVEISNGKVKKGQSKEDREVQQ